MALSLGIGLYLGGKGGMSIPVQPLYWHNQTSGIDISLDGRTLTSNGTEAYSWLDKNIWSNTISTDGNFDVTFKFNGTYGFFGVSADSDNNNVYSDIRFGFYAEPTTKIYYIYNGGAVISLISGTDWQYNCRLVSTDGGANIDYYYNDALVYTHANPYGTTLKLKASFYDPNNTAVQIISI